MKDGLKIPITDDVKIRSSLNNDVRLRWCFSAPFIQIEGVDKGVVRRASENIYSFNLFRNKTTAIFTGLKLIK